jgi:hypothetical protein
MPTSTPFQDRGIQGDFLNENVVVEALSSSSLDSQTRQPEDAHYRSPKDYLNQEIFPVLLPGLEKLLKAVNVRSPHPGSSMVGINMPEEGSREQLTSPAAPSMGEPVEPLIWLAQVLYGVPL